MNRVLKSITALFCLSMFACAVLADVKTPVREDSLSEIVLEVPQNDAYRDYLGLAGDGSFAITQIKARVVIIEIFSMYCPYCQKEAPVVNSLYSKIQKAPLKDRIKIIGIGTGNTDFEVEHFRKTYGVPFPLFSDNDFSIHKKIGEVRTPYFFIVRINPDGTHRILTSHSGPIENLDEFLNTALQSAGVE